MPKKAGLTGGTGDVNPQWYRLTLPANIVLNITGGAPGATSSSTVQYPVPVPKFPSSDGSAIVMEILKCRWTNDFSFDPQTGAGIIMSSTAWLSTKQPTNVGPSLVPSCASTTDGSVIDFSQGSFSYQNSIGLIYTFRFEFLSKEFY